MRKRINYEPSGNEDEYVKKCLSCKHSYTKTKQSDTLFCSLKMCRFEPEIIGSKMGVKNHEN